MERAYVRIPEGQVHYVTASEGEPLLLLHQTSFSSEEYLKADPGLFRAIRNVWPEVAVQRCVIHRLRNVLARVPKKRQEEVRKALYRIFYAACLDDARDEARSFMSHYSQKFPTACETLAKHLEECLTFYRFPEHYWKHIWTSNVIERSFKEVKQRTNVLGRFPNETSVLVMVFSLLEEERIKWRRARISAEFSDREVLAIQVQSRFHDQDERTDKKNRQTNRLPFIGWRIGLVVSSTICPENRMNPMQKKYNQKLLQAKKSGKIDNTRPACENRLQLK